MIKHNQNGAVGSLAFPFMLTVFLLIISVIFGVWAFSSRQDYKNNTDAKINAAVTAAKAQEDTIKDAAFAAESEDPLTTYNGPEAYGSLVIQYPKTWSGYVDDSSQGTLFNAYFSPGVVPSLTDTASVFALRVSVLDQPYAQVVQGLSGQQKASTTKVAAYALPKLPNVVGVEVTGQLPDSSANSLAGTMVILPLRANTLEIWTEGTQYLNDFNSNILANFSFSP